MLASSLSPLLTLPPNSPAHGIPFHPASHLYNPAILTMVFIFLPRHFLLVSISWSSLLFLSYYPSLSSWFSLLTIFSDLFSLPDLDFQTSLTVLSLVSIIIIIKKPPSQPYLGVGIAVLYTSITCNSSSREYDASWPPSAAAGT